MVVKKHVNGKQKGDILIYALSTCGWCRKTKNYLNDLGIAYDYIDVDLLSNDDSRDVMLLIKEFNNHGSFPTIIVNNKDAVIGYDIDRLNELMENSTNE